MISRALCRYTVENYSISTAPPNSFRQRRAGENTKDNDGKKKKNLNRRSSFAYYVSSNIYTYTYPSAVTVQILYTFTVYMTNTYNTL